jgi:transcriptional regulator with XRE-family HTH domain
MAIRSRPLYEAVRLARWLRTDMGRELRLARRTSGMRQSDVARLLHTSQSRVCRVEHGRVATLNLEDLARHAAAVGLKPSFKLYPLGRRLLDKPQLELLARFRTRLHSSWLWATEVPIPRAGDLRSCDCIIRTAECVVLVEAFTAFVDFQAQSASAMRKKRDFGADRLVLLVAATHANRRALAEARAVATSGFSLSTKAVLSALAEGRDPGTDAIVLL